MRTRDKFEFESDQAWDELADLRPETRIFADSQDYSVKARHLFQSDAPFSALYELKLESRANKQDWLLLVPRHPELRMLEGGSGVAWLCYEIIEPPRRPIPPPPEGIIADGQWFEFFGTWDGKSSDNLSFSLIMYIGPFYQRMLAVKRSAAKPSTYYGGRHLRRRDMNLAKAPM